MSSPPKSPTRTSRFIEADISSTREQSPSALLTHILSEQDQNESRRRSASASSSSSPPTSPTSSHRRSGSGFSGSRLTYCSPGYYAAAEHDAQMMSHPEALYGEEKQSTGDKIKGRLRALTLGKGENKARTGSIDEHKHHHG